MNRGWGWLGILLMVVAGSMAGAAAPYVYVGAGGEGTWVDLATLDEVGGTVSYQGPVFSPQEPNWKPEGTYQGPALADLLTGVDVQSGDILSIIATDGYEKRIPASVLTGNTEAGTAILATRNGDSTWEGAPMLVFLAPDGQFGNEDMLAALGEEYAHDFGGTPSTTGLMVKNVMYVLVNYDGTALPPLEAMPKGEVEDDVLSAEDPAVALVIGETSLTFTRSQLEEFETITAPGTFTNSASVDYTAEYTGVPLYVLLGNISPDATVLVTAADGYVMNYPASLFLDTTEGTWILAYKENGAYMPLDPGYYRIVQAGPDNPHFTSSLSARMVERIEVQGAYEPYTLTVSGEVTRTFTRGELEAGIGCPCHTATVTVTSKGETDTYAGLPLWRLVAYVDDDSFPSEDQGIHYDDEDFNDALAQEGYVVVLTASDGYSQRVPAQVIAHDDRFIVAFKKNGSFLDPSSDGSMRFVYDDSVVLPDDVRLKSVKFLASIDLVAE